MYIKCYILKIIEKIENYNKEIKDDNYHSDNNQ